MKHRTARTVEDWAKIQAMGTYECKFKNGELWSFNGEIWYLSHLELSPQVMREIVEFNSEATIEGCWNHGPKWKAAADRVNAMYGTHIQRSSTQEEKGVAYRTLPTLRNETAKYKLVCKHCGHEYLYKRCTKAIRNPGNFRCGVCRGELRLDIL